MKSTRVRRELIIIRTAKELPSRRNVAKYEIEHSAWIESSEIQWTAKVPTRLLEPKFFFPAFVPYYATFLPWIPSLNVPLS